MKDNIEIQIVFYVLDEIAKRRKELGMSHRSLAERTRIDRSTISLIENKKRNPSLFIILKICKALGISLAKTLRQYEKVASKRKEKN